jgi:hypothetical protein
MSLKLFQGMNLARLRVSRKGKFIQNKEKIRKNLRRHLKALRIAFQ